MLSGDFSRLKYTRKISQQDILLSQYCDNPGFDKQTLCVYKQEGRDRHKSVIKEYVKKKQLFDL